MNKCKNCQIPIKGIKYCGPCARLRVENSKVV